MYLYLMFILIIQIAMSQPRVLGSYPIAVESKQSWQKTQSFNKKKQDKMIVNQYRQEIVGNPLLLNVTICDVLSNIFELHGRFTL